MSDSATASRVFELDPSELATADVPGRKLEIVTICKGSKKYIFSYFILPTIVDVLD